jgi:uncharacterized OB-fold protein
MTAEAYLKPVPEPTHESRPYWDGLKSGRLLLQKCGQCGKIRHYPRPVCDACYSFEVNWIEASGRGTVHSWTITHHAFNPGFKLEVPYILVTVDLDEGVRMQVPLRGAGAADVKLGLPVRIIFEQARPDLVTPACVIAS